MKTAWMPASGPRSSIARSRARSTGASSVTKTITETGGLTSSSSAARFTSVPKSIGLHVSEYGPRGSASVAKRETCASRALSSVEAAGAESARANSLNGLVSLVVCGSHLSHSSSGIQSAPVNATVTTSLGACSPKICTARPRIASAAAARGPATPREPALANVSSTGTSSTYRTRSRSLSSRSTYSGRPSGASEPSSMALREGARHAPSRIARKFQCSGRRVHSSGPSRIASSKTSATGGTSRLRASSSTGLA
jgi:hypothetical protein